MWKALCERNGICPAPLLVFGVDFGQSRALWSWAPFFERLATRWNALSNKVRQGFSCQGLRAPNWGFEIESLAIRYEGAVKCKIKEVAVDNGSRGSYAHQNEIALRWNDDGGLTRHDFKRPITPTVSLALSL